MAASKKTARISSSLRVSCAAVVLALLAACSSAPVDDAADSVAVAGQPEPELTLHLDSGSDCEPADGESRDYTFLDRGLAALAAGDHIDAVRYFQRYQRLESSPETDWEAAMAIAYTSMLPQSPFFDPGAASNSYRRLQGERIDESRAHSQVLLMRDALAAFSAMQAEIAKLNGDKRELAEDLAKREEAIKRLRELTLGQKGAAQ